jgi:hypothetical protein
MAKTGARRAENPGIRLGSRRSFVRSLDSRMSCMGGGAPDPYESL